jgi:aldehyde:ferredoxin oxidoreductase
MDGWRGCILDIDLGQKTITRVSLDPEFASSFIGGRGFNDAVLSRRIPAYIDPLGPENVICFAPGPFGTPGNDQQDRGKHPFTI